MKEYIFGYGSLIEKESRLRTTPSALVVYPIVVNGLKRGWFARTGVAGLTTTFLGCVEDPSSHTNGVIYQVDPSELESLDEREKGYHRVKISEENVVHLTEEEPEGKNIWVYVNNFDDNQALTSSLPNKDYPIVQSYVDMCINGCLEIEAQYPTARLEEFAAGFIRTTHFWSKYWVNDRIYPRRPFIYRPNAYEIDRLLKEYLPDKEIFDSIYFE